MCAAVLARAVDHGAHRERGFADGADWVARVAGSSTGEARLALRLAEVVGDAGEGGAAGPVGQAWATGGLSAAQAAEIVRTEADCPGTAADRARPAGGPFGPGQAAG